jgi:hypothetical protein
MTAKPIKPMSACASIIKDVFRVTLQILKVRLRTEIRQAKIEPPRRDGREATFGDGE